MLGFWPSDVALVGVQAAVVAAPLPRVPALLVRLRGSAWAWVLPLSLGATIALLALLPDAAMGYTWLALLATPPLAALVFARPIGPVAGALLAAGLLAVAWAAGDALVGQAAALAVSAASCVALGAALVALAPVRALKAGIVAMAVVDAILVFSHGLQQPNDVLNAATPGAGLPRLQLAAFGDALMGYGDLFIAAVLGAVLARERRPRGPAALLTFALAVAFDLLFLVTDLLPATVPVAAALLVLELARRRRAPLPAVTRVPRAAPGR